MEYVRDRGWFADPPIPQLLQEFHAIYPKLWQAGRDRLAVSDPAFGSSE